MEKGLWGSPTLTDDPDRGSVRLREQSHDAAITLADNCQYDRGGNARELTSF
jgi:hypothetical protein